ncbi:hypothetical protein [Streptomyces sp. NPDC089915]|uniref:hypothetical protein n=1 Tax=Streptomyces sp. NPDC089915 TaxID=3155186 RepID=UPI003440333B
MPFSSSENVSDGDTYERWKELAYIRGASSREFTTTVENIVPAYDQPQTAAGRRDQRSA